MSQWHFVDRIQAAGGPTPTVLLDLNDGAPWNVYDWDAPPPELRVNTAESWLSDGSTTTGEAFSDRVLTLVLDGQAASADGIAVAFQALVGVLSAPAILRYSPPGSTKPVYFRTKRCSPKSLEEFRLLAERNRQVTLEIPADPFAYGQQIAGTVTVTNDPTAVNGMRFELPAIVGDVAAPLNTLTDHSKRLDESSLMLVTSAGRWLSPSGITGDASGSGFVFSTLSDATAIGGDYVRAEWVGDAVATKPVQPTPVAKAGEYRVLVRGRTSNRANFTISFAGRTFRLPPTWGWVDLGIARFPVGAMRDTPWTPVADVDLDALFVFEAGGSGTADIDSVLFIPSPGADRETATSLLISRGIATSVATRYLGISGDSQQVGLSFTSDLFGGGGAGAPTAGGLPVVVPGRPNYIFFASLSNDRTAILAGAEIEYLTSTIDVIWSYHPRYLYMRGV